MNLQCDKCGGLNDIETRDTVVTCSYCRMPLVVPQFIGGGEATEFEDFNRAGELRRGWQYDDSVEAYDEILRNDPNNAEAHWGRALARYGVEYVDDGVSQDRKPTLHRLREKSITSDRDYMAAMRYAPNDEVRQTYKREAKRIADIAKKALAIVREESPYDIFICYKHSVDDENHSTTQDFGLATKLYLKLTTAPLSYRVFFSNISLAGKTGQDYEPIIYAALSSAKVMLVIGTRAEYVESVWVKNEWSRFAQMADDDPQGKLIIPCYKGISPNALPQRLSRLQGVDLGDFDALNTIVSRIQPMFADRQQTVNPPVRENDVYPPKPRKPSGNDRRELQNLRELLALGHYADARTAAKSMAQNYAMDARYWFYRAAACSDNFELDKLNGDAVSYIDSARRLAEKDPHDDLNSQVLEACRHIDEKRAAREALNNARQEVRALERSAIDAQHKVGDCKTKLQNVNASAARMTEKASSYNTTIGNYTSDLRKRRFMQLLRVLIFVVLLLGAAYCYSEMDAQRFLNLPSYLPPALDKVKTPVWQAVLDGRMWLRQLLNSHFNYISRQTYTTAMYVLLGVALVLLLIMLKKRGTIKKVKKERKAHMLSAAGADIDIDSLSRDRDSAKNSMAGVGTAIIDINDGISQLQQKISDYKSALSWSYNFSE